MPPSDLTIEKATGWGMGIYLIIDWCGRVQPAVDRSISWQVVLDSVRKRAE